MSSIAVLTATRAEYGLLRPVIQALNSKNIEVRLLVTGMHLSPAFGMTVSEINNDGFIPDVEIPILLDSDSPVGISKTMALALGGFADYFSRRRPDALLVLGDRYVAQHLMSKSLFFICMEEKQQKALLMRR